MGATKLIDDTTDRVYLCMYRVASLVFMLGAENVTLSQANVLSMEKLDNYEYNVRSIIRLQLQVDIRQKIWIIKNRNSISCKFELVKFGNDTDNETQIVGDQDVWNTEFAVFLNDDDANIDTESMENAMQANEGDEFKANDTTEQGYYSGQQVFDVYLYNNELLTASKKQVNKVYSSATLQAAIGNILTESGHKNVLMSPIQNSTVYNNLIIPSNPAYKAITYLDQYYGLYALGASIYYDVDTLYIINPNGKETATLQNEYPETDFLITSRENSRPGNGMVYKPEQKVYYANIPEEAISMQKPAESKSATYGSDIELVTVDTMDVSKSGNSGNTYQAYMNSSDNQFASSVIQARMDENNSILYITADALDINAFSLNKAFYVIFEDATKSAKYGKSRYRIAYASHKLVIQSDQYMKSSHQISLKKCSDG